MPAYKDVCAAIHVDGKPLDEYQLQENDAQKEVSCWIPSQVGKEFATSFKNLSRDKHMSVMISVDGCMAYNAYLPPLGQGTVSACEISPTTERPLLFSNGKLVDDDELRDEMPNSDDLGTITLSFREGRANGLVNETANKDYYNLISGKAIPEQRQIPERGKKGIQACVALGPVKARIPVKRINFERTNDNMTRVVFRYRPLDYLQAQGIAPPPPPPPPQPRPTSPPPQGATSAEKVKRKRADDVRSQAKRTQIEPKKVADIEISDDEDIEKLQALRTRIDKILAKKNVRVKKEIKTERREVISKGDVIDLT